MACAKLTALMKQAIMPFVNGTSAEVATTATGPASDMKKKKIVIFVDIPDPDNMLMIIYLLRYYLATERKSEIEDKISIVLSPRALDLSVPRYNKRTDEFRVAFGGMDMLIDPIRKEAYLKECLDAAPEELKQWFYLDRDCNDPGVKEDTKLYMKVSVLRAVSTLAKQGFTRDEYDLYWDPTSLTCPEDGPADREQLGDPLMRHAFHADDFKYNFSQEHMAEYEAIIKQHHGAPSQALRKSCRDLLNRHVEEVRKTLQLPSDDEIHGEFKDLIPKLRSSCSDLHFFIGGPFTEVARYFREIDKAGHKEGSKSPYPVSVTAMAGFWKRGSNIFPNQFNIHADCAAAEECFKVFESKGILTKLVPTECIKNPVLGIPVSERDRILKKSKYLSWLVDKFHEGKGPAPVIWYNFDGITAVADGLESIFEWKNVSYKVGKGLKKFKEQERWEKAMGECKSELGKSPPERKKEDLTDIYFFVCDDQSPMRMAVHDEKYIGDHRDELEERLRWSIHHDVGDPWWA